ncbi:MAG TPA: insulinase family protein [Kofleriaceae bacterium]|jgi:zinc protease|nr:insulinase family protein [Kofleriaceae bacterium]
MTRHLRLARVAALALAVLAAACGSGAKPATTPAAPAAAAPAAPAVAAAPAAPNPDDIPLPLWPEVKHGKLANGLTYYVLKHGKPEKRAFLWLAVNAGSVQENDDQRGLAHFDEHMAFNGTRRFPKADIVNYLEKIGMRFGADLNARTTFDDTVYELEVPTDKKAFLDKGLDILHDWAGDVSYDPVEVDKERGVVMEEWRLGRGAQQRLFDKEAPVLFKGSRYAVRLPIGLPEVIQKAPRDKLYQFYKDWYRPDLMAVIAVGDFDDPAAIEQAIQSRFADLKNPANERARIAAGVPTADGTRVSIQTDREQPDTALTIYNLMPHRPEASAHDFRRILVEQIYQRILNDRLVVIARRPDAPFATAAVGIESPTREVDVFAREALPKGGQVEPALEALLTEVLRVEQHGVTQSEFDRARAVLVRFYDQIEVEDATSDSRNFTEEFTRNFFEGEFMIGRKSESGLARQILPTITLAEMNELGKSFGGAANRVILIDGAEDNKAALPTKERVLALIDEVSHRQIPAWEDRAVTTKLMEHAPKPGKIVKEARRDAVGVTEWTLSNGARVIIKPTDFVADKVSLRGTSPGGLAMASDKEFTSARFADDIAAISGFGDHDTEELGKLLAGKDATAGAEIGDTTESIQGEASVRDLETMFQLVHLEMTAPRLDDRAITTWRQNLKEQLTNRLRDPEAQFSIKSEGLLYHDNPRRMPPTPGDIDKLDPAKALAFYKSRFGDATDFTFVIVGTFDPATLRPLVETYLASLPAHGRKEKQKDLGIRKARGVVKHAWMLGQEPKAHVEILFHGDEPWSRDKDRDVYILSQVLEIRLREVLREDKGGVYGVGVGGRLARAPHQERDFSISFGCDPLRITELINATFDEIAAVQKNGISDEYLEKVKQTFTREREVQLRKNQFWLEWLGAAYTYGDDPALIVDPSKMIARMTSANVQAAARHYLDSKQFFEPVLLPAK